MKSALSVLLAVCVGAVFGQGVSTPISPPGKAPAGCSASFDGNFMVTVAKVAPAAKRDLEVLKRAACAGDGILVSSLSNGVLKDSHDRTGYIASNFQFQYDGPPQAGALYTAGFSACPNGSLALGSSATFYACVSGSFSNLYDRSWAAQCSPVEILILPCGGADSPAAGEISDGQVVGTQIITTTVVSAISDGQPQVITKTVPVPLCQITDGQLQVKTTPCASVPTAKPSASAPALPPPVSQFSDGQIQVTAPGSVPTVTSESSVLAGTTPAVTPQPTSAAPSGSVPAETKSSTPASGGNGTTSNGSSTIATSATRPATSSPATSAPVSSGAGVLQRASMAALAILLVGAVVAL